MCTSCASFHWHGREATGLRAGWTRLFRTLAMNAGAGLLCAGSAIQAKSLNYLRYFHRPDAALKGRHTGSRKWQRKSKESSGNNLNEVLAEEPGAMRRSSCSGSAFRNCHGEEKKQVALADHLPFYLPPITAPEIACEVKYHACPLKEEHSCSVDWEEPCCDLLPGQAQEGYSARRMVQQILGVWSKGRHKAVSFPSERGTSLIGWSLWKSILD